MSAITSPGDHLSGTTVGDHAPPGVDLGADCGVAQLIGHEHLRSPDNLEEILRRGATDVRSRTAAGREDCPKGDPPLSR